MKRSQERLQAATVAGYFWPKADSSKASKAARAAATARRSLKETKRIEARIRCTTQVWTVAFGQVASTASGNPVSPSQHTISTSFRPRLRNSEHTPAQNLAPSLWAI